MTGFEDQRIAAIASPETLRRLARRDAPAAWRSSPRRAAKQASLSNRGQHSQSIAPSRATSAARR
jgi:hypothetical protein